MFRIGVLVMLYLERIFKVEKSNPQGFKKHKKQGIISRQNNIKIGMVNTFKRGLRLDSAL